MEIKTIPAGLYMHRVEPVWKFVHRVGFSFTVIISLNVLPEVFEHDLLPFQNSFKKCLEWQTKTYLIPHLCLFYSFSYPFLFS